jgi:hypothetical protein
MDWVKSLRSESEHATRLANDLEYFCGQRLKVRPKDGGTAPFVWNEAQRRLHAALEDQKRTTGRVRAIVLKGRQMGISTYVAARFYRHVTTNPGLRCSTIAHEVPASRNLRGIVDRYHANMPDDEKPSTSVDNADALTFDKIDSGYLVSVANPEGSGRSATVQLIHASEVGFWADLGEQIASLGQACPDIDGSEIIMESTAKAFGDQFHQLWRQAQAGDSEYIPIFLPWSIEPGYREELPDDFQMTREEAEIAELHGLDAKQIMWRRNKIRGMLGDEKRFMREYPLTPTEAFQAADFDSFIGQDDVMRARKNRTAEPYGDLILGVDIARKGKDSTVLAWRQGRVITKLEKFRNLDLMQVAGVIAAAIDKRKPARVFLDETGLGAGVLDRLREQGYDEVHGVNFAGKPIAPPRQDENGKEVHQYANRRAEIYGNLRDALQTGSFAIPDDDALHGDLTATGYKYNSNGALLLESKEDVKKRLGAPLVESKGDVKRLSASPDLADACALTFAIPLGAPPVANSAARGFGKGHVIDYPPVGIA